MTLLREDFAGQRQLRFRVEGQTVHLFKHKGESTHHVTCKILVYALYHRQYPLELEPRLDCKYQPDVASLALTGDVQFWAQCGEVPIDHVAYVLKHSDAEEVVLVREDIDLDRLVASIKRHIHYRYTTGKLRILVFRNLDEWFNPDDVVVPEDRFTLYSF
ncbi:MAG TPA: hypothetical protein V6D47_07685 [Oscillatoriaceae cyanobacterium]